MKLCSLESNTEKIYFSQKKYLQENFSILQRQNDFFLAKEFFFIFLDFHSEKKNSLILHVESLNLKNKKRKKVLKI